MRVLSEIQPEELPYDLTEEVSVKSDGLPIAYRKMPRGTFALLHPMRATKIGLAMWVGRQLLGRRR